MEAGKRQLDFLSEVFSRKLAVESTLVTERDREYVSQQLGLLAKQADLPLVATTAARAADLRSLRKSHVLRAIQMQGSLSQVEPFLEAFLPILRSAADMVQIHKYHPEAVTNAAQLAGEIAFDFRLLAPQLPVGQVSAGETETAWLRKCAYEGAKLRYDSRAENRKAWETIDHELKIIANLGFCGYFLIVKEIVDFCKANDILCQGRGSAANSAVCYALGITAVDAVYHRLMFERFLSPDRSGPPDIDIDIEAKRREEVIQHVFEKYGRHNAAQVANVITYRHRSAIRDAAKAFGFSEEIALQWDKEYCAEAGLVKFVLLGLGMLTALRRMFSALEKQGYVQADGRKLDLYSLPAEDPQVCDLLCADDTVGVFQVESRAQMNTLPRLRPRCFYDLVVEVVLIRPGPIQGNAVNPYLRRCLGKEPVRYVDELLKPILERTLGVPFFQEQLMQIAVEAAGFSAAEADQLRKAMGSKRSEERMRKLKPQLYAGLAQNGIVGERAEEIFEYFSGFAEFSFPESHAFSFAYIVYASAWMKVHFPHEFYASIIASQPMGFYSVYSLVADAHRRGVRVLPRM